jgi:predicted enzyme related to lactoylglutathione lyase
MYARHARSIAAAVITAFIYLLLLSPAAFAQAPGSIAHRGAVIGTGTVTGFVDDMDRSLAFYHDVFAMEVPEPPASGRRPWNPENAQLFAMFDIPGAMERHQAARVPDSDVRFELMEIRNVDYRTIPLRIQDPGAMTLVFTVRDIDALLGRIRMHGGSIVTPGGSAIALPDGGRAVTIRDIDGRFIELREPPAVRRAPPAGPAVTAMRISIAVDDLARTLEVYRDVLGFTVLDEPPLVADAQLRRLTGLSAAEFRRSTVLGPESSLPIEFVQYDGVERRALTMRIQDRGAARLQIRADDVEALVASMKKAGLRVVSEGGAPVPIPPNFMGALVADPNNFFLTPFAPCDGCAPRLLRETH